MLTKVRKRLLPLTKREGSDSVIISNFFDTNHSQLTTHNSLIPDMVFSHFTSHFSRKRIAFTLAEVLITLGIIGVVAALTLPSLITNYQKQVIETRLSKFYTTMNQAVLNSQIENGDFRDWELSKENNLYKAYLKKYLKTTKEININSQEHIYLPDGSYFYETFANSDFRDIFYCPLGNSCKRPGIDRYRFAFSPHTNRTLITVFNNPIEPYTWTWNGDIKTLRTAGTLGCNKENRIVTTIQTQDRVAFCTAVIMLNGWKFPKDYPW